MKSIDTKSWWWKSWFHGIFVKNRESEIGEFPHCVLVLHKVVAHFTLLRLRNSCKILVSLYRKKLPHCKRCAKYFALNNRKRFFFLIIFFLLFFLFYRQILPFSLSSTSGAAKIYETFCEYEDILRLHLAGVRENKPNTVGIQSTTLHSVPGITKSWFHENISWNQFMKLAKLGRTRHHFWWISNFQNCPQFDQVWVTSFQNYQTYILKNKFYVLGHCKSIRQCGKFIIFLSVRFYVKSILGILELQILPFNTFRDSELLFLWIIALFDGWNVSN